MELIDLIFTMVYGFLAVLTVFALAKISNFSSVEVKRYRLAILLKVFGAVSFVLIYALYYKYGGDAHAYFEDAVWLNRLFIDSPIECLKYAFGTLEKGDIWSHVASQPTHFQKGTKEFFVTVIFSIFSVIGLENYYATTIVFAFVSFFGHWLLYRAFANKYPEISLWAFVCVFALPSGLVWGAGLVKENVVLALLGVSFHLLVKMEANRKIDIKNIILFAITYILIAKVKLYVVLSLMPPLAIWISFKLFRNNKDFVIRKVFKPIILLFAGGIIYFSFQMAASRTEELNLASFVEKARSVQDWHFKEGQNTQEQHGRGSSYTLGSYKSTLLGTISMIPASINVTYFRPYPWEVNSPIVAFVSLESLIVLFLVLYVFTRKEIYKRPAQIFGDPFFIFLISYALILGFLVGFTSYNFGALDRYKIPAMPFFIFSMMILNYRIRVVKSLE